MTVKFLVFLWEFKKGKKVGEIDKLQILNMYLTLNQIHCRFLFSIANHHFYNYFQDFFPKP